MSELTEFLLARITEDEAAAGDAYYEGQRWAPEEEAVVSLDRDLEPVMHLDRKRDAWFAADWSPARVLAECAAKRKIVDNATNMHTSGPDWNEACRILATIYADHPAFDPEWAS